MKKILFFYIMFTGLLFGYNYDEVLLKAQSAIFPKIILLDKKIDSKLIDGKVVYTIVYNKSDQIIAESTKEYIDKKFQGYFGIYEYKINLVEISNYSKNMKTSAVYVLNLNENIENIAEIAKDKGVISFSYDINNLKRGLMFSLVIEKSTVLYLKREDIYSNKIEFIDSLLQMVKFVEKEDYAQKEDKRILKNIFNSTLFYANNN